MLDALDPNRPARDSSVPPMSRLVRDVIALAAPIMGEYLLHSLVGLNDVYLANHLPSHADDAGAAVGTITYFVWFFSILVGSIGTGSTALIARARGAAHRSLANRVCGQSVAAAVSVGIVVGTALFLGATPIIRVSRLDGLAAIYATSYLRRLSLALPFTMLMLIAGSCLRGAGDTVTPAIVMILVDVINMGFTFLLTRGFHPHFGKLNINLPAWGFNGIATGTIIAYVTGGVIQFAVLLSGRGGVRLYLHRLRPHWITVKRIARIGLPAAVCDSLEWIANLTVIGVINNMDPTNASSAAHITVIRLESFSYLSGIAFGAAAATMVGISLGMRNPARAVRSAFAAYIVGGGAMTLCGILFVTLGRYPSMWLSPADPQIVDLTTRCLMITGFIQSGFAANLVFGGALRGAGDTLTVMLLNLSSVITLRFTGVLYVGYFHHWGLAAVWVCLSSELFIRGSLVLGRFLQGGWKRVVV